MNVTDTKFGLIATVVLCLFTTISLSSAQPRLGDSLRVTPDTAIAGTFRTVTFIFTVGNSAIKSGGGIRFELPVAYSETEPYFWSKPQTHYPDAPGYLVATSSDGTTLNLTTYGIAGGIFECVVDGGRLSSGESVTISYRGVVQSLARSVPMRFQVLTSGEDAWMDGPDPPTMHIEPREVHTLITTTPADIQSGRPFAATVVAIDRNEARYFMPPYEWYNAQISAWTDELDLTLINYSPGTRSHADYTTPDMEHYVTSRLTSRSMRPTIISAVLPVIGQPIRLAKGLVRGLVRGLAVCPVILSVTLGVSILSLAGCGPSERASTDSAGVAIAGENVAVDSNAFFIRINLLGYLEEDSKVAIVFSHRPILAEFSLVDASTDKKVAGHRLTPSAVEGWGRFAYYYEADFSSIGVPGRYYLKIGNNRSPEFGIGRDAYGRAQDDPALFRRRVRILTERIRRLS